MKAYVAVFTSNGTFMEWHSNDVEDVYQALVDAVGRPDHVKAGGHSDPGMAE